MEAWNEYDDEYNDYFDKYYDKADVPKFRQRLKKVYSKLSREELELRLEEIEVKFLQSQFDHYNDAVRGHYKVDVHKAETEINQRKLAREGKKSDPEIITTIEAFLSEEPEGSHSRYLLYCRRVKAAPVGSNWFYQIKKRHLSK